MTEHIEPRCAECGERPGSYDKVASLYDKLVIEKERYREERNQLYGYTKGLLGLLRLVQHRNDMPPAIAEILNTNYRSTDAAAYLTQIVPPLSE